MNVGAHEPWIAVALSLLGGVATAFTPCVYPMIPITVGVMGVRADSTIRRSLLLSFMFVLGLATIYSLLGYGAASTGRVLGSLTQQPWMIALVSSLFFIMGLSLLGLFEIRLPFGVTQWLARQGGQGVGGSFALGMVSGLLAAPCSGPVVVGILAYVAQKSNPVYGFLLLFVFSLGLGLPFVVLASSMHYVRKIPRSGVWSEWVRNICGFALIGSAFFFVRPIVSPTFFVGAIAIALTTAAVFLPSFFPAPSGKRRLAHNVAGILLMATSAFLVGRAGGFAEAPAKTADQIVWIHEEAKGLAEARSSGRPLLIDFSAEWCAACQELDEETFQNPRVREMLRANFVTVRIDATEMTADVQKILERYSVLALPRVLFLDPNGNVMKDLTVDSFVPPAEFLPNVEKAVERVRSRAS